MLDLSNHTAPPNPNANNGNGGIPNAVSPTQAAQQGVLDMLINYNQKFAGKNDLKFRDEEIFSIISQLMSCGKSSVLITGAPGTGKTAVVEEIAKLIAQQSVYTSALNQYTIYELPLTNLMAGTSYRGQLEEKTKELIEFCEKNKVILFIDEIHQLMGHSGEFRGVAQMLKPAMARGSIKMIGATTLQESKNLLDDPAFARRFSKTNVPELTVDQTVDIIKTIYMPKFMKFYNIQFAADVAETLVAAAERVKTAYQHRPDNAITLLDKLCAHTVLKNNYKIQTETDPNMKQLLQSTPVTINAMKIENFVSNENFKMPETQVIDNIKFEIQKNDDFIDNIYNKIGKFIKRNELFEQSMFKLEIAGEKHSGRTTLAKLIAESLDETPIYIDLAEYNTSYSLSRLIGSEIGLVGSDSKRELVFDIIESNPRKVVILDNYDKMSSAIANFFETSFSKQSIKYADNRDIDISKTIFIIVTEKEASSSIGFVSNSDADENTIYKLTKDEYKEVAQSKLDKAIANIAANHPKYANFTVTITDEDVEDIDNINIQTLIEDKIVNL